MLEISKLNAWYGPSHVLQDVGIEVAKGEIVCLIGRNGAGKTTTLRSIMGLMDRTRGSVVFRGKELLGQPAHMRFALGLAYVPLRSALPMCRKNAASFRGFLCGRISGSVWSPRRKRSERPS